MEEKAKGPDTRGTSVHYPRLELISTILLHYSRNNYSSFGLIFTTKLREVTDSRGLVTLSRRRLVNSTKEN